ncbi:hypothetical protein OH708_21265 [Pseudomonas capsici]|uniref:hypothetical protein n=1 Tax=Pseudomonas capsici TaxID=2810614 RepID=UPI0021F1145E|nr:hypothetical protein [Pseudomonas capsici]MCV4290446.1 hypothetical protein [Pseudomonas capsici]
MDRTEAKILLKNLLRRIKPKDAEQFELTGVITDGELTALNYALAALEGGEPTHVQLPSPSVIAPPTTSQEFSDPQPIVEQEDFPPELDLSIFDLPKPSSKERLCLDFGTAMSKATLVMNGLDDDEIEEIHVLELGIPGDQHEVSDTMLISSLYIDNKGLLWFGNKAVEHSGVEGRNGERMRIDNVKRYLSEGAIQTAVTAIYNPTPLPLTGGDVLLAYLMFMTWTVNEVASKHGVSRNIERRFAMPCFDSIQSREVERELRRLLGEAQVLADTFADRIHEGLSVQEFTQAVRLLRATPRQYDFVSEALTEPLGVANALLSSQSNIRRLILIVDVGAGTSDVSLYRLHADAETGARQAVEAKGAARGIPLAGNYLDRALTELIMLKAGIKHDNPRNVPTRSSLALSIREYKEILFNNGSLDILLLDGQAVEIKVAELDELEPVKKFKSELRKCVTEMLEQIDESWVGAASHDGLAVILTGGGSNLNMVQELMSGDVQVKGRTIRLIRTASFPGWLKEQDAALEDDFPRIAVSLGGGRLSLISSTIAQVTAGDVRGAPTLPRF